MHTYSPYRLVASEPRALGLGVAGATLRAVAVAAALACGAGASWPEPRRVNITSFTVSAADFSGNFALATDPFQSYDLQALEAGGPGRAVRPSRPTTGISARTTSRKPRTRRPPATP